MSPARRNRYKGTLSRQVLDRNLFTERSGMVLTLPFGKELVVQALGFGPWRPGPLLDYVDQEVTVSGRWYKDESFVVYGIEKASE